MKTSPLVSSLGCLLVAGAFLNYSEVLAKEPAKSEIQEKVDSGESRRGTKELLNECKCFRVDVILIEGLLRTRRAVVERELLFQEGDIATIDEVERSVRRLRNTGLFQNISYEFIEPQVASFGEEIARIGSPGRLLRIELEERWTLTPSFGLSSGGETFQLRLGAQDANLFGTFRQVGGQYTRLGETNSFAVWYRDPRFFDRRLRFTIDGNLTNRQYSFYNLQGELQGGYLLTRWRGILGLQQEWRSWARTALHFSLYSDTFSYSLVSDARREGQESRGGLPGSVDTLHFGLSSGLGRIDEDTYRFRGTTVTARIDEFFQTTESGRGRKLSLSARHFTELPLRSNLAIRAHVGLSWMDREHQHYFVGGLDAIRGTVDKRYSGEHYWLTNFEFRIPSLVLPWLVLQHVAFLDVVGVGGEPEDLLQYTAATTGLGIRILSPEIYGLLLRIDYALPILGADGPALSFGAGQFF